MFDEAEGYASGNSEKELYDLFFYYYLPYILRLILTTGSGRVIKELGLRRTDIIVTTKLFWGGHGPNDMGLSRKQ